MENVMSMEDNHKILSQIFDQVGLGEYSIELKEGPTECEKIEKYIGFDNENKVINITIQPNLVMGQGVERHKKYLVGKYLLGAIMSGTEVQLIVKTPSLLIDSFIDHVTDSLSI